MVDRAHGSARDLVHGPEFKDLELFLGEVAHPGPLKRLYDVEFLDPDLLYLLDQR